jgi:kynureninase
MGHAEPFAFRDDFAPAADIRNQLCGTPTILGLAALEVGVDLMLRADLGALAAKSAVMCDLFIAAVEGHPAGAALTLVSPREGDRGSHVSFAHPQAYGIIQALIARGVVGDFRAPDVARFGFTPLYLRHVDVLDAADVLLEVMAEGAYKDERFIRRLAVT